MPVSHAQIVRIFNNNAVLASRDGVEFVLAGRGIGFGKKSGDNISEHDAQRVFTETSEEKISVLKAMDGLDPVITAAVAKAVDMAVDLLGDLFPSVYVVLADHLAFAIQRIREGQGIENYLVDEISAVFPKEFAVAQSMVRFLNEELDILLPLAEAAFIALHLNAAQTGVTVKDPMRKADQVSTLANGIARELGKEPDFYIDELISEIIKTTSRLTSGKLRSNKAAIAVAQTLPRETEIARQMIHSLADQYSIMQNLDGEVAFFAMALHGWAMNPALS